MADEDVISTSDVLVELNQAARTFAAFEHGKKVVLFLQQAEQKQKACEDRIVELQAEADGMTEKLAERIKTAELRAEDAEQRAAMTEKDMAAARAKLEADTKAVKQQLSDMTAAVQKKIADAKTELADVQAQTAAAKKELADLQKKAEEAKKPS